MNAQTNKSAHYISADASVGIILVVYMGCGLNLSIALHQLALCVCEWVVNLAQMYDALSL